MLRYLLSNYFQIVNITNSLNHYYCKCIIRKNLDLPYLAFLQGDQIGTKQNKYKILACHQQTEWKSTKCAYGMSNKIWNMSGLNSKLWWNMFNQKMMIEGLRFGYQVLFHFRSFGKRQKKNFNLIHCICNLFNPSYWNVSWYVRNKCLSVCVITWIFRNSFITSIHATNNF